MNHVQLLRSVMSNDVTGYHFCARGQSEVTADVGTGIPGIKTSHTSVHWQI
jgi:hypothetical protein